LNPDTTCADFDPELKVPNAQSEPGRDARELDDSCWREINNFIRDLRGGEIIEESGGNKYFRHAVDPLRGEILVRDFFNARLIRPADAALRDAAKLALELLERAAKDAGDDTETGCPFNCHDEDCENCLSQRAEKALRAALAASPEQKEESK